MPSSIDLVTHARSREELRDEFLSDIERRIKDLELIMRKTGPSAVEASRISRSIHELEKLQTHWKQVQIRGKEEI